MREPGQIRTVPCDAAATTRRVADGRIEALTDDVVRDRLEKSASVSRTAILLAGVHRNGGELHIQFRTDAGAAVRPAAGRLPWFAGCGGRSVVTRAFATSPLRLLTPRITGRAAWIYTSRYGGGLVDGDGSAGRRCRPAHAAPSSVAVLDEGVSFAERDEHELTRALGGRRSCVLVPDPVVCFAARGTGRFSVRARGDSGLVLVDWVSSGRHASGERWRFDEYVARCEVRGEGTLVLLDALALPTATRSARPPGTVRRGGHAADWERDRAHAAAAWPRVSETPVAAGRAARPARRVGGGGCLLRVAGTSVEDVAHGFASTGVPAGSARRRSWARKW